MLLVVLAAGLFVAAYMISKSHGRRDQHPPIPFIEERVEETAERPGRGKEAKHVSGTHVTAAKKAAEVTAEEMAKRAVPKKGSHGYEEQRDEQENEEYKGGYAEGEGVEKPENAWEAKGITCPNGHPLVISMDESGYPGGYYMCANCNKVKQCSLARWNCQTCNYDICPECKPVEEVPMEPPAEKAEAEFIESEEQKAPGEGEEMEEEGDREAKMEVVSEEEDKENKREESQEVKEESSPVEEGGIEKVIESNQAEMAQEFKLIRPNGKVSWVKTHFIFVIDCSGSMKGPRWNAVKAGYKNCLMQLRRMKQVIVSAFTFDDKPNPFVHEKTPGEAVATAGNLPFTGKGTNYKRALEYVISLITKSLHPDYLSCIIILSDGLGGYPEDTVATLCNLRERGRPILFYTIACVTEDDDDMVKMVTALEGDHYKIVSAEAAKQVFAAILEV